MRKTTMLILSTAILFGACKKDSEHNSNNGNGTFSSNTVSMYNGTAKTWVSMKNNVPQQLAISISDAAMNSLSADEGSETEIDLPSVNTGTTVDHIAVDWNPHGHPPQGVYTFPHFDFHFYMISKDEQMAIPDYAADSTGFLKYPSAQYMPENYIAIPGGEAMMGTHWVDVTSPELNGKQFTQTFIYGSYNGEVNFYEPMITKAFLDSATSFERSIPQPQSVQKSGYYPTKLKVAKHDGVTEIILSDFVMKNEL